MQVCDFAANNILLASRVELCQGNFLVQSFRNSHKTEKHKRKTTKFTLNAFMQDINKEK